MDDEMADDEKPLEAYSPVLQRFIRSMQALDIAVYGETVGPGSDEINRLERMWRLTARGERD